MFSNPFVDHVLGVVGIFVMTFRPAGSFVREKGSMGDMGDPWKTKVAAENMRFGLHFGRHVRSKFEQTFMLFWYNL